MRRRALSSRITFSDTVVERFDMTAVADSQQWFPSPAFLFRLATHMQHVPHDRKTL